MNFPIFKNTNQFYEEPIFQLSRKTILIPSCDQKGWHYLKYEKPTRKKEPINNLISSSRYRINSQIFPNQNSQATYNKNCRNNFQVSSSVMTNKTFKKPLHPPLIVIKQEPPVKLREFRLSSSSKIDHAGQLPKKKHEVLPVVSKGHGGTMPIDKNSGTDQIKTKLENDYDKIDIDLVDKLIVLISLLNKTKL